MGKDRLGDCNVESTEGLDLMLIIAFKQVAACCLRPLILYLYKRKWRHNHSGKQCNAKQLRLNFQRIHVIEDVGSDYPNSAHQSPLRGSNVVVSQTLSDTYLDNGKRMQGSISPRDHRHGVPWQPYLSNCKTTCFAWNLHLINEDASVHIQYYSVIWKGFDPSLPIHSLNKLLPYSSMCYLYFCNHRLDHVSI